MPIPSHDAWHEVQRTVRRVRQLPPRDGLTGGVHQRYPPHHGFVRVVGERQPAGFYLGVVTEHDSAAGTFNDRLDVPVWVRTPNYHLLTVGTAGATDGVGVYWGRAQDQVEVEDELDTGTGGPDLLPEYVVDDTGFPGPGGGTGTGEAPATCLGPLLRVRYLRRDATGTGTGPEPQTYTLPADVGSILVELVGGGGGAGRAAAGPTSCAGAGGGGAGAYTRVFIADPDPSYSYSVGEGGYGGSSGASVNVNGDDGGETYFGSYTAPGGKHGTAMSGAIVPTVAYGGSHSAEGVGDYAIAGNPGFDGWTTGTTISLSGTLTIDGSDLDVSGTLDVADAMSMGGMGGASHVGTITRAVNPLASGGAGNAYAYGSGGSGGVFTKPATPQIEPGGDGKDGIIIVWEFAPVSPCLER